MTRSRRRRVTLGSPITARFLLSVAACGDDPARRALSLRDLADGHKAEPTFPPPSGAVEFGLAGGAGEFRVHLARVRIGGGAGTADIDGEHHTGVPGGTVLTTQGWTGATDRYDIDLTAGGCHLSRLRPSGDDAAGLVAFGPLGGRGFPSSARVPLSSDCHDLDVRLTGTAGPPRVLGSQRSAPCRRSASFADGPGK